MMSETEFVIQYLQSSDKVKDLIDQTLEETQLHSESEE